MHLRMTIVAALLLSSFTAVAAPDGATTTTSPGTTTSASSDKKNCPPGTAAQEGADEAIRKAEEEAEKFGDNLIAASDLLEKCIGAFSLAGFSLNLFTDLGLSSIIERLKKEICALASDHLGDAVDFMNDQIDDAIWGIIGGAVGDARNAIGNIPGASQILPTPSIQTPSIKYSPSSSSSSSGTSPTTTSNGTIYTPADPSTGSPASITYTDAFNKKPVTITADQLGGGSYTFDAGNGVIGVFTPDGPYSEYAGSIVYLGGGYGGQVKKGFEPKPDGRLYSPHPNPWAGIAVKSNSSAALSSDASSSNTSWWSNIWK